LAAPLFVAALPPTFTPAFPQQHRRRLLCRPRHRRIVADEILRDRTVDQQRELRRQRFRIGHAELDQQVAKPEPAAFLMGFLWMGVGPLVAGAVAEMFGLKWQAMIQGLAFMSHQVGSFLGAFGGGVLYDALGSYTMAWRIGVALGLAGGIIQVAFALVRPSQPPVLGTA
jgi:hypothetical protein